MRNLSVKLRVAVWLTLLMTALSLLMLTFMMSISSSVVTQSAMTHLESTVRANLSEVTMTEAGKLELGPGFSFAKGGVSTLIYSSGDTLLAGQVPVSFQAGEPFRNGLIRTVSTEEQSYLLLDLWLPLGWENGLWLRGLMEMPAPQGSVQSLLLVAVVALPLFVLLAALGSYLLTKRSFRPLDTIMSTVAAISDAKDLSGRIALPPGRDEFSRLADSFNGMFARLEQSFEAEKQFTADASHELRTPISIIKGACDYARQFDETPEDRRETIEMINRQATRMSGLISQLLNMTRLDQGTEALQTQRLNLSDLAAAVCKEWGMGERLHFEGDKTVPVQGDAGLLTRLLQNLLENACKYGREQGQIWVSVRQADKACLLSVRDDGIGIDAAQQEKIWQRFYQVDPARSDSGGAGLGLSMVQQIARAHDGEMTLESVPDAGSVFTLHLPIAQK